MNIKNLLKLLIYFPFLPFVFLLRILSIFFVIRLCEIESSRIGHFGCIIELYLCEKDKNSRNKYLDLFFFGSKICNIQIKKFWEKNILILPRIILKPIKFLNQLIPGGQKNDFYYREDKLDRKNLFAHRDINNLLDNSKLHCHFDFKEINQSIGEARFYGINLNKKIVVINLRDNKYFEEHHDDRDLSHFNEKNCDIDFYRPAIEHLISNNYQIIRCGKRSSKQLNLNDKNYIDLTNIESKSDRLEMYLNSICNFFIGCNSGPSYCSLFLFKKLTYFSNYFPHGVMHYSSRNAYYSFKSLKYIENRKELGLEDIVNNNLFLYEGSSEFNRKKIKIFHTNSEIILQDIKEIQKISEKKFVYDPENELLQKKFINFFQKTMISESIKNNLNFRYYPEQKFNSIISKDYLKKVI